MSNNVNFWVYDGMDGSPIVGAIVVFTDSDPSGMGQNRGITDSNGAVSFYVPATPWGAAPYTYSVDVTAKGYTHFSKNYGSYTGQGDFSKNIYMQPISSYTAPTNTTNNQNSTPPSSTPTNPTNPSNPSPPTGINGFLSQYGTYLLIGIAGIVVVIIILELLRTHRASGSA